MEENYTPEEILKEYLRRIQTESDQIKVQINEFFEAHKGKENIGEELYNFRPVITEFAIKYNSSFPDLLIDNMRLIVESTDATWRITAGLSEYFSQKFREHQTYYRNP